MYKTRMPGARELDRVGDTEAELGGEGGGEDGGVCGTECGTFMCTGGFTPSNRRPLLAKGCEFE